MTSTEIAAMELAVLRQSREDVWNAILAAASGERVKEVTRDGRRIVRDNMKVSELQALLALLDRRIIDAEYDLGATSTRGRRAIAVSWA